VTTWKTELFSEQKDDSVLLTLWRGKKGSPGEGQLWLIWLVEVKLYHPTSIACIAHKLTKLLPAWAFLLACSMVLTMIYLFARPLMRPLTCRTLITVIRVTYVTRLLREQVEEGDTLTHEQVEEGDNFTLVLPFLFLLSSHILSSNRALSSYTVPRKASWVLYTFWTNVADLKIIGSCNEYVLFKGQLRSKTRLAWVLRSTQATKVWFKALT
jgi:hypothetical protein